MIGIAWIKNRAMQNNKSNPKLMNPDTIYNFIDSIKTAVKVPDDHKLVPFDAKSLFTSISLQLALDYTKTAINNGKHYKQPHGTGASLFPLLWLK